MKPISRRILSLVPIFVYFLLLVLMYVGWMQFYLTDMALDYGLFTYVPYVFGGAFLTCFFLGRLVWKISGDHRIWVWLAHLLFLLVLIYVTKWLSNAMQFSYPDYTLLFQETPWWYGFHDYDTKYILAQSALGFLLGQCYQLRKTRRRLAAERSQPSPRGTTDDR